jgi:putative endonuclease
MRSTAAGGVAWMPTGLAPWAEGPRIKVRPRNGPSVSEIALVEATVENRPMQGGWVYIVTNRPNGTVYVGVTSDLARRVWEHREGVADGFTKKYGLKRLVWAEHHDDIRAAIQREHNLKHWPRAWKIQLIVAGNPGWTDLYDRLV